MTKEEWEELTQSIWRVERELHPHGGHCCPMPVKLAENVIKLFSHKGGLVADIFGGSGTMAIAAIRNQRDYVLIEKSKTYCAMAKKRIEEETTRKSKIKLRKHSAA